MRSLISRIGEEAGLAAEYWRDGFYFYDRETGARARVEQRYTKDWSGEIPSRRGGGRRRRCWSELVKFIDDRHIAIGARLSSRTMTQGAREEASGPTKEVEIKPVAEPSTKTEYFVSYAGTTTPREAASAKLPWIALRSRGEEGHKHHRDKTAMRYGDRISKFMSRIADGDRIFIVLSDKYLKSAYCMHELYEVWRNCSEDDAEFIDRTRIYVLPCAKIKTRRDALTT